MFEMSVVEFTTKVFCRFVFVFGFFFLFDRNHQLLFVVDMHSEVLFGHTRYCQFDDKLLIKLLDIDSRNSGGTHWEPIVIEEIVEDTDTDDNETDKKPTKSDDDQIEEGENNIVIIILSILGVILIAGGILFFIILKKRKKN